MAASPVSLLERQVRKVRRRLFLQHLVNALIFAWLAACAAFAIWWVARPHLLNSNEVPPWMDYTAGGVAFVVSTIVAIVVAARRTPSTVTAALTLDERFQLRERVTTSLMLDPALYVTPAGQALLGDVEEKITKLDVRSRFPVRFGWKSALVPVAVAALFVLAILYHPFVAPVQGGDTPTAKPLPPEVAKELEQKKQEFLQKPKTEPKDKDRAKSIDSQKIEAQLQEILKRPMTTKDEVKDRLAELTKLEEEVKKKEKEEAAKIDALKDQLSKLDKLNKKEKAEKDGGNGDSKDKDQTDELRKSLKDGDTEKAKKEADRLSKKLKDNQLNKEQKDHLKDETKELKEDLERLKREREKELDDKHKENEAKRQEKEKQLEQQRAENKLDKEEFDKQKKELDDERKREQQQAKNEKQQLDQLAKSMEKCEQSLKDGDQEGAAQALREAAKQLDEMEKKEQDLDDLQNELQRMQDLRESMAKACDDDGKGGNRSGEDDAEQLNRRGDDEDKDGKAGSGGQKGNKGKGKRPDGKQVATKSMDAKQKADFDKKGAKIHVGSAGQAEKVIGKSGVSLQGEIKQASQDAPESVETQRIPRGYKDSTKGYFKNIGNQKTGEIIPKKD